MATSFELQCQKKRWHLFLFEIHKLQGIAVIIY